MFLRERVSATVLQPHPGPLTAFLQVVASLGDRDARPLGISLAMTDR